MCVVYLPPPNFMQVIEDEETYLDRYIYHSAQKIAGQCAKSPLVLCGRITQFGIIPTEEEKNMALEKYKNDRAHYLATGELPK